MKTALLLAVSISLPSCFLTSCAADAKGNKTFLDLTGTGWAGVVADAATAGVMSYGQRRILTVTATK